MPAEILQTHTPELFRLAVGRAVELLTAGEVVAVPTETVYGLAANALHPEAIARIFAIKGRPSTNPIIVHVASGEGAMQCAAEWPELAQRLASAFWPGPLTLVVPASHRIPRSVTAGGDTVAIRWPQHPFMQAVIRATGFPLAAPSANKSNQLSPTEAAHVALQLGGDLPLIVDGGACNVGIESTVVDTTGSQPRILRPGMITETMIREALPDWAPGVSGHPVPEGAAGQPLRSPGMLARHYSPKAQLVITQWSNEQEMENSIRSVAQDTDSVHVLVHRRVPIRTHNPWHIHLIPDDSAAYARAIYSELHACDAAGARWIIVEQPRDTPEWQGVRDRLIRASARRV